jgi:hypothetical protein
VVLEKDGEKLDRSCDKLRVLHRGKEDRNILHTIKREKASWIGHILHKNCLLKHAMEEKLKGKIEVMERQRRQASDNFHLTAQS